MFHRRSPRSPMRALARQTIRTLHAERQLISCDGETKAVVRIPDYQVKLAPGKPWHRRGGIEGETACGEPMIDSHGEMAHALRAFLLDDELCDAGCFSPRERALGAAHVRAEHAKLFDVSDVDDER